MPVCTSVAIPTDSRSGSSNRISAPPESDGGWDARLQTLSANAMPHDLSHWIVAFGGPLLLEDYASEGSVIEVTGSDARISLVYSVTGETERVGAEFRDLVVTTHAGSPPDIRSIDELLMSGAVDEEDGLRMRLAVSGVRTAPGVLEPDVERAFGDTARSARIDLEVTHWSALADGANAIAWRDAGGTLQIADAELEWGPAHITGNGDFTIDSLARPDGRLSLRITDPDTLADALIEGRRRSARKRAGAQTGRHDGAAQRRRGCFALPHPRRRHLSGPGTPSVQSAIRNGAGRLAPLPYCPINAARPSTKRRFSSALPTVARSALGRP